MNEMSSYTCPSTEYEKTKGSSVKLGKNVIDGTSEWPLDLFQQRCLFLDYSIFLA
jgi:hypothetical protein